MAWVLARFARVLRPFGPLCGGVVQKFETVCFMRKFGGFDEYSKVSIKNKLLGIFQLGNIMASTTATEFDDVLTGSRYADAIEGGMGDDIINSGAGDDTVDGGAGDDQLNAGSGDDVLIGGAGDDVLNGGGGSDTFVFNFTVAGGQSTVTFGGFDAGADGKLSQNEFVQQYEAFLVENGFDPDAFNQNSATDALTGNPDPTVESIEIKTGATTQTRYYEDTLYVDGPLAVTASDGHDTITAFQDAGPNVDQIVLNGLAGLSDADLDSLFDLTLADTDGDGTMDASVLVWGEGMGSITIGGTTQWGTDVLAFLHDGQVLLA